MTTNDSPQSVHIISVPTEAGTHWAGQGKAPAALIEQSRLPRRLEQAGLRPIVAPGVFGTQALLEAAAWKPAPIENGARNETATLQVMDAVEEYLSNYAERGFPLILGGDCSIAPAVLSGLHRWHPRGTRIGLVYFDGDADLTLASQSEAESKTAILDGMVMSHLTARPGGLESMQRFRAPDRSPLVTPENVVFFGFDPLQPLPEHWVYLLEHGFKAWTRPTVQQSPQRCAENALAWLRKRVDVVHVHFDVDAIDAGEFPLGNYPHYSGLQPDAAFEALRTFLRSDLVQGMTLTEVNPNNDPNGAMVDQVVENIVDGLKGRYS